MTELASLSAIAAVVIAGAAVWWLRRRRAEALMGDLVRALALAAEAQQVHWRLQRRYTDDLAALASARRELARFVDASAGARWELGASEDGSTFDLAILALPVAAPLRWLGRRGRLGYRRLLTAHGDHGVIAYDSFAEERRYRPRAIATGSMASAGWKPSI